MLERLRKILDLWREDREIDALSDREIEDLGVTRGQLHAFARLPMDVPDRVHAMAAIFGLTEDEVKRSGSEYLELLEVCARCGERKRCAETLDDFATARPEACGFCPNARTYVQKAGLAA